jgi:hypothetical protein
LELERRRALGPEAALLLDSLRILLRGPSFLATDARIKKGVERKPPGGTQLFYKRDPHGDLRRASHSGAELEQLRDAREAKLSTQILLITDVIISARTGGRRAGFVGFLFGLVITAVGKVTQFAQSFAACLAVTSSHAAARECVRTVRERYEEHYRAQLARDAKVGLIFIFDNYAFLQFANCPGALGLGLTTTIATITVLVKVIAAGKPAKLSVDPHRLPAMAKVGPFVLKGGCPRSIKLDLGNRCGVSPARRGLLQGERGRPGVEAT